MIESFILKYIYNIEKCVISIDLNKTGRYYIRHLIFHNDGVKFIHVMEFY